MLVKVGADGRGELGEGTGEDGGEDGGRIDEEEDSEDEEEGMLEELGIEEEERLETLDGVDTVELEEELDGLLDELGTGLTDEKRLLTTLPIFPKSLPIWPIKPGCELVGVGVGVGVGESWLESSPPPRMSPMRPLLGTLFMLLPF